MKFFIHRKKGLDAKEQIGLANMHTGQSVILKKKLVNNNGRQSVSNTITAYFKL